MNYVIPDIVPWSVVFFFVCVSDGLALNTKFDTANPIITSNTSDINLAFVLNPVNTYVYNRVSSGVNAMHWVLSSRMGFE